MSAFDRPFNVYVVDDDPVARMTACSILAPHEYAGWELADAPALLAALQAPGATMPDLVLLDVEMPGMDGIEACRRLRASGNDSVQVMFVSSHDDLQTRLAAYDAGGNDFIVKPYELDGLACKIGVARQSAGRGRELGAQMQYAQSTAFIAMSSMAEMGSLLDFLRNSFACRSPADLAQRLCDCLQQFGLDGLVELRYNDGRLRMSSRGECSPLELNILEHAGTLERIFQFSNRLTVNYP